MRSLTPPITPSIVCLLAVVHLAATASAQTSPLMPSHPDYVTQAEAAERARAAARANAPPPGTTETWLPLGGRGGVIVEAAAMNDADRADLPMTMFALSAHLPVSVTTFWDVRVPVALGFAGNPSMGVHRVHSLGRGVWLSAGGAMGAPLGSIDEQKLTRVLPAQAAWDVADVMPHALPVMGRFDFEVHSGALAFRAEGDPIVAVTTTWGVHFVAQQAVELQLGHELGAGLRLQAVWLPTFEGDVFHSALEPFAVLEHRHVFARAGLMMPLDAELGPPFEKRWGARLAAGLRIN
jgi:hypothetical protein